MILLEISLSGNAKSKLSLQCSLDLTDNQGLKSLNPNLVAAKVSESMKNVMNQERPSVKTKEVITVNTSLDLDTFSKLLPFLRCYFVNSPVNEENKLNGEDQASKTTRLIKTTNPMYSTNADASNTTRLNETTDPTYSTNADGSIVFNVGTGSSTAVQFSNAVVCTSNAAEEIEIARTSYQTFQPKTSEDLTETINSNATSISDLSIQPETSESLTESIPTSIADQTPKTSEGLTITINRTSTRIADQTETDPVYINMACQTIQPRIFHNLMIANAQLKLIQFILIWLAKLLSMK
ncbi:hypothetical protein BgiBS90_037456 [Biomphalaria glabrata]|nr:hypothetical protein BgiBS90_037456 [Biomphalaria glabrata]